MSHRKMVLPVIVVGSMLAWLPALHAGNAAGQSQVQSQDVSQSQSMGTVAPGDEREFQGVVVGRDEDGLTVKDRMGIEWRVLLTDRTDVKEKKFNPFRHARNYAITQLLVGLDVEVKAVGNGAGQLVAREVKFRDDDYRVAQAIEARVDPVEADLRKNEKTDDAQAGQIDEVAAASQSARDRAQTAQQTAEAAQRDAQKAQHSADGALSGVNAVNHRVSGLDNYQVQETTTVNFAVGSAKLSDDARQALDQMAGGLQGRKGFMLEVAGFASADGNAAYNRRLSQRRADAVVQYLVEGHNVSLRRIITPFGFGENQPVADNSTREGRE